MVICYTILRDIKIKLECTQCNVYRLIDDNFVFGHNRNIILHNIMSLWYKPVMHVNLFWYLHIFRLYLKICCKHINVRLKQFLKKV